MLFPKSIVVASLAGAAVAKSSSSVTDLIPKCAQPCIAEAQKAVTTCQLTDPTCLCSSLASLQSNQDLVTCFTKNCDVQTLTDIYSKLAAACASLATASGAASGSMSMTYTSSGMVSSGYTSAVGTSSGIYSNSTATSTGGSGSGSGGSSTGGSSGPAATSSSAGSNPSPTTKPSAASRSEFGMASLAVALVVAMVSL